MMKFLDDEGRAGTGVGRKAVLRAHAPRPAMSGAECSCGERFATWEEYGRHVDGHCGCGWKSSVPDIGEWRRHMADAILAELAEVRKRG